MDVFASMLMFRCRTNTLKLRCRNDFLVKLCGVVEETVDHFVVECGGLRETKEKCVVGRGMRGWGGGVGDGDVVSTCLREGLRSEWKDTRGCWMRCGLKEGG